jgi:hypothetical protein
VTIREYVEKRGTLIGRLQLVWGVVVVSGSSGLVRLPLIILAIVFALWLVAMIVIAPLMRLLTRCPRCGGVLLQPIFRRVIPTPDNCPHCAVNLDEPMGTSANPQ